MDVGLVGSWTSDPEDLDGIETFGRVSLEFSAGGSLTYTIHGDRGDQTSLLTYVAEGGVIETDQPSQPRRERTAYELTPDGRLMLWFGRQRSVYLRASGATTTPGVPGEPGSARSSILSVVRRDGTSDAVAVEDDGRVAYAYLLEGERIVSDVWLYNRVAAPLEPEWTGQGRMPFANAVGYARPERVTPIACAAEVSVSWDGEAGNLAVARVALRGEPWAELRPGQRPGLSRVALKDGPLARVLATWRRRFHGDVGG